MYDIRTQARGHMAHGMNTCAGCGMELILRNVLEVVGDDVTMVCTPGCAAIFCGFNQEAPFKLAGFQGNLDNAGACATGISRALRYKGNDHTLVLAFVGDGGTIDVGLQALSGMMERGDDVLYICYDNEAYMNTGIQGSGSTPFGAWTTTTPGRKSVQKKDLLGIAVAHGVPYCASASIANLKDLRRKVERAKNIRGPRLLHILCPCPTGWRFPPSKSVEISKNALNTGAWVLYEVENGKYSVNFEPKELKPITEYLKYQDRFKNITQEEIEILQAHVVRKYNELLKKTKL